MKYHRSFNRDETLANLARSPAYLPGMIQRKEHSKLTKIDDRSRLNVSLAWYYSLEFRGGSFDPEIVFFVVYG